MLPWLRPGPPVRETAVAMIDPRPGDTLVFLGGDDLLLAGSCGAVAGMNGRTVVVDQSPGAASRIEAAGGKTGALLEHLDASSSRLPLAENTFHIAIGPDIAPWPDDALAERVAEALRVLRHGGRILLIAKAPAGLFGKRPASARTLDTVLAVLSNAGSVANRRIASVKGTEYYEGRKPR